MLSFLAARLSGKLIFYGGIALLLIGLFAALRVQTVQLDTIRQQLGAAEATIAGKQAEVDALSASLIEQRRKHAALAQRQATITQEKHQTLARIAQAKSLPAPEKTAGVNALHREIWSGLAGDGQ